jgi:hypothetical protein
LAVTDAKAAQSSGTINITIAPAVSVNALVLPTGALAVAYPNTTLTTTGGVAPYSWSVATGQLPAGLALNAATGVISGTATVAGSFPITVKVTDGVGASATKALNLTITAPYSISTASLASGLVGKSYAASLAAVSGKAPYKWTATGLPAGLTLTATGKITGLPTVAGVFNPTFKVTDSKGLVATKALSLKVDAIIISTAALKGGKTNTAYSVALVSKGGVLPYTWTLTGGTLPAGFTLSAAGKITGKTTNIATFNPVVTVTDSTGAKASKALSLTIVTDAVPVDIANTSTVTALNTASKLVTTVNGGVTSKVYYDANTSMIFNTAAGDKITSIGSIPAGVTVGMPVQGAGNKSVGKITATSLEFN